MKKNLLIMATLFLVLLITGCNSSSGSNGAEGNANNSGETVEISMLIGKAEIQTQIEEAVKTFNDTHENIDLSIIPLAGQKSNEKQSTMYASGNPPTIMAMSQSFDKFQENLLDLSGEPWVEHALPGTTDFVTVDNKVYGMPQNIEAFGFIYNKKVIEEAIGDQFDPYTIDTREELKQLFDKVNSLEGKDAIYVSPMDWSLGAHLTNPIFAAQSKNRDERHKFMEDMASGEVNLNENEVFNGWFKTFEMMKEYNSEKESPLAATYDQGAIDLASGNVGFWFMGNWALPQIQEVDPDGEYGFLPVPISNNPDDYGNKQISVGVPSYFVIDASKSTKAQQEAAKEFLNWLVSTEEGQEYYVNKFNFIPAFDNFEVEPESSLSQSVLNYSKKDLTLEWMNTYYPPEAFPTMGAIMQKYLVDEANKEELTNQFEEYWKSAELK